MKILQIIYSLSSGGGERFVVDLCNRLAETEGNEVVLLTVCDSNIPQMVHYLPDLCNKVRFENLHKSKGLSLGSMFGVYSFIKKEKPDVVHLHSNMLLCYPTFLLYRKCKYIHTLHSVATYCAGNKVCKVINSLFYKKRVQPITISSICQKSYVELYGSSEAIQITNGREALVPSGNLPSDVHLADAKSVFIHVARCAPVKNQPRLFRAFDRLYSEGESFELLCLGSNYDEYIDKYKEHPQIHILGEKRNVADYMALADYFVLSSNFEGLPLTLLEAMSLGVTPISTPAGGVADVIRDGENGYMTNGFEDEEYYQKIKQAIHEFGRFSKEKIKQEYEEHYSMKVCADKYMQMYLSL